MNETKNLVAENNFIDFMSDEVIAGLRFDAVRYVCSGPTHPTPGRWFLEVSGAGEHSIEVPLTAGDFAGLKKFVARLEKAVKTDGGRLID